MSASVRRLRRQPAAPSPGPGRRSARPSWRRLALHALLATAAVTWLFPVLWAVYAAFRPYADTATRGYISLPGTLSLQNFATAWGDAELARHVWNSVLVTVPAVVLVLMLGSMIAFGASRLSWRMHVALVLLFTAGNLLPPQAILTPLHRLYLALPLPAPLSDNGLVYDQLAGLVAIHVAFQLGFCVFVLSAYMKTLPRELVEAALIDGASLVRALWHVVLPLCRPVLAALAVLQATWIYNDFFWALVLIRTGDKRPATAALDNLGGEFFTDHNVLAAAALLVALPTLIVFLVFQRQLTAGLAFGTPKG
jgi:multiple sugar transport system permease protein